jgi:hypothetical protein
LEVSGPVPRRLAGIARGAAGGRSRQLAAPLGPSRPGAAGGPPPREELVPDEGSAADSVEAFTRYYRLDGIVFRARLDRLDQGAQYLRNGAWVWTPITSGGVIDNPQAIPLSDDEADRYRDIE